MTAQAKKVECGCTLILSHKSGEMIVACSGSEGRIPDGVLSIRPEAVKPCPGGVKYAVEASPSIQYTARPVEPENAA